MYQLSTIVALLLAIALLPFGALGQGSSPAASASTTPLLLTGYFPQWGLYNEPQYLVKNLVTAGGAAILDQLNYAQGFVTNRHCSVADPNADLNYTFSAEQSVDGTADTPDRAFRGNLHQLVELKRLYPHLKVVISLEGSPVNFAEDALPENREAFVDSCVDLFLRGKLAPGVEAPGLFDGIDIDWEYPHKEDAANYVALLTLFRQKMEAVRPGLLLNIAVGTSLAQYEDTDMGVVGKLVDQIGLMTYDFAGPWSGITGFVAPLRMDEGRHRGTVEGTVNAYLAAGVPPAKLMMGVPFYGYGWHQVLEENNGLYQEGEPIHGDKPYRYIAPLIEHSTVYRDAASQAPWLFDGDVFWTYEDPVSIQRKAEFARERGLGGFMIWELGEDTADAQLLQSAHRGLAPASVQSASGR